MATVSPVHWEEQATTVRKLPLRRSLNPVPFAVHCVICGKWNVVTWPHETLVKRLACLFVFRMLSAQQLRTAWATTVVIVAFVQLFFSLQNVQTKNRCMKSVGGVLLSCVNISQYMSLWCFTPVKRWLLWPRWNTHPSSHQPSTTNTAPLWQAPLPRHYALS